jgi:hypothetical protein
MRPCETPKLLRISCCNGALWRYRGEMNSIGKVIPVTGPNPLDPKELIKQLPPYEVMMQRNASLRSITQKMHEEIKTGPFRLFSDKAIEEITRLVDDALSEGYFLGLADGK